jgi:polysaccharide biosynthesis protein PslG
MERFDMRYFRTLLPLLLAALAAVLLAMPAAADAAKRRVPFGFFGTVAPQEMMAAGQVSDAAVEQQMALMARSGVESVRVITGWVTLEPSAGVYDWTRLDRVVAAAARHGIVVLPNVTATPQWNSPQPNSAEYWRFPPVDPNRYAELMRQAVLRYGPLGSFWAQNPTVPRVPIRQWQIWNEQTAPWHWNQRPWAPSYTQLLRAAYGAIHAADRGAKVVAGALVAFGSYAQWDGIRDLYRGGAKRFFDAVAVHPFTNNSVSVRRTVDQMLEIVRRVRVRMRRRGDARKPILLTEMTWPAAIGRVPKKGLLHFATTRRGQAKRLEAAYRRLARARRKLGVRQADWYVWASQYDTNSALSVVAFRYSGLTRFAGGVFSRMPILRTYTRVAAKYQGCRKSSNARRCRR